VDETQHADGDIGAGVRGLFSSLVANDIGFFAAVVICAIGAAAGWAFTPSSWDRYLVSLAGPSPASVVWPLLITGAAVIGTAAPIALQFHKRWLTQQIEHRKATEQAELIALIKSFLTPCIETLPDVAAGGSAGIVALATVRRAILSTVQHICGPSGAEVRVVWFEADKQTMVAREWLGGQCNSTRRFTNRRSDVAGTTAWETARTGLPTLWADLSKQAPRGFKRNPASDYATFITCGVLGRGDEVRGMINVDAPKAKDLTEIDKSIVGVCAKLLGTAYALSELRGSV
jgi:hypothetical protein